MSTKLTRRKFLKVVGAGAAWVTLSSTLSCEPAKRTQKKSPPKTASAVQPKYVRAFRSRPDLRPPAVEVSTHVQDTAPGYIFVAPKRGDGQYGPLILDNSGQPVWFRHLRSNDEYAMDFKVQHYRGEPVLTWAEGRVQGGYGLDEYVVLDSSYQEITRVRAGNGYQGDHHEFLITPQDTALFTIYSPVRWDLSPVDGPKDGVVLEGIAQEVDIETGEVLFEWHSLDHIGLEESYVEQLKDSKEPFDYFHINSIEVDHDDNLLISARLTSGIYKIDRKSGDVIWRLGGKKNDFELGPGTQTSYQHDARRQSDGTITIFDNAVPGLSDQSRGIVLELDEEDMVATLVREYAHPEKLVARTQGNMQVLPNGNVFIGWGNQPFFSEFSGDGELLFDANFPPKTIDRQGDIPEVESYRAFRFPWSGHPSEDPAVVAEPGPGDEVTLYASWNGATEVATWQVLAGPSPNRLEPIEFAPRHGFETAITVRTAEPYTGVQAKDRSGRVLGSTKPVKPEN